MTSSVANQALSYNFKIDSYHFSYDAITRVITGRDGPVQIQPRCVPLLLSLLESPGKLVSVSGLSKSGTDPKNSLLELRKAMRKANSAQDEKVYELDACDKNGGVSQKRWPIESFRGSTKGEHAGPPRYRLNAEITGVKLPDSTNSLVDVDRPEDAMAQYRERTEMIALADRHISTVMKDLLELFPNELEGFFYRLPDGTPCQFHLLQKATHGAPDFPLEVSNDNTKLHLEGRGPESLVTQRFLQGARLNNGSIYSLRKAQPGKWRLGRTCYFDIVDSCDWIKASMFEAWGRASVRFTMVGSEGVLDESLEKERSLACREALKKCKSTDVWRDRVSRITADGDFSTYAAGMAFTLPILATSCGLPNLLLAEGSSLKATGGGKLHCCPAGMLEFYPSTTDTELSFEAFKTYMTKELVEETLAHKDFIEEDIHERLMGEFHPSDSDELTNSDPSGETFSLGQLEGLFNKIVGEWDKDPSMLSGVNKLRSLEAESLTSFQIVDAFVLRPEIIVPLYLDNSLSVFTCWEHKGTGAEYLPATSYDDVVTTLKQDMHRWAAPGLAAALLSFEHYFKNHP